MEWKNKFHDILEETERNLKNAKGKLKSNVTSPHKNKSFATLTTQSKSFGSPRLLPEINGEHAHFATSFDDMKDSTSMQVLHMQEQISSQNRMIEKLQRLVKSLDSEREYYKEQISVLKKDIDMLTDTMKNQTSMISSDLKVSSVKNEVMHEINKVKAMVHNYERDSAKRSNLLSPRFDTEFWDIKENLTDNLEEVRFELNQMKRRIDLMEDRLAASGKQESLNKKFFESDRLLSRPLYTPTNSAVPHPSSSDLQFLRLNISSLNEKLDNLEQRSKLQPPSFLTHSFPSKNYFQPNDRKTRIDFSSGPNYYSYTSTDQVMDGGDYDAQSLSDLSLLSDLSNLSDDGPIDELDFDLMTLNLKDDDMGLPLSSQLKSDSFRRTKTKGKVEFDLNDLDLSDFDDEHDIDLDPDNLDLLD